MIRNRDWASKHWLAEPITPLKHALITVGLCVLWIVVILLAGLA